VYTLEEEEFEEGENILHS